MNKHSLKYVIIVKNIRSLGKLCCRGCKIHTFNISCMVLHFLQYSDIFIRLLSWSHWRKNSAEKELCCREGNLYTDQWQTEKKAVKWEEGKIGGRLTAFSSFHHHYYDIGVFNINKPNR